jgi:hypothetical protein
VPERFRVEVSNAGCERCHAGQTWDIVHDDEQGEPMAESTSYEDREAAEDLCEAMNRAYFMGWSEERLRRAQ